VTIHRSIDPRPVSCIGQKADYVRRSGQTRNHHCHWTGCTKQVPPAMWGCRKHWFMLPRVLRAKIWRTYKSGQEIDGTPSREYVEASLEVREWIAKQQAQGKLL
jgi:hypothetical protein